jgi:magnesium transporter
MISKYKLHNETWVDLDHGTAEEIKSVVDEYGIHPFVGRDMESETLRPRIEFHDGYIYCILHFPVRKHTHSAGSKSQEVDFVVGRNVLITSRYDTIDALHKLGKTAEVEEILKDGQKKNTPASLFSRMLGELYGSVYEELEAVENTTEEITSQIFGGRERDMVAAISEMTRSLLDFKKTLESHHEILESLHHHGRSIFGDDFGRHMETVMLEYLKLISSLKGELERLHELRDTNNSLLSSKQSETMRQLTVISFVILPLELIAFIFAMRTEGMPIVSNPNGFWIVIGIMVAAAAITVTWARSRNWM